jgi:hypothetical protein
MVRGLFSAQVRFDAPAVTFNGKRTPIFRRAHVFARFPFPLVVRLRAMLEQRWNSNPAFGAAKGFPNGRSVKGRQIEAEGKDANRSKARERTDERTTYKKSSFRLTFPSSNGASQESIERF